MDKPLTAETLVQGLGFEPVVTAINSHLEAYQLGRVGDSSLPLLKRWRANSIEEAQALATDDAMLAWLGNDYAYWRYERRHACDQLLEQYYSPIVDWLETYLAEHDLDYLVQEAMFYRRYN